MNRCNPIESIASAVYTALESKDILPDIERTIRGITEMVRPSLYDVQIIHFPQLWGSTALGFGGMGGAAMTTAYTTVIMCKTNAAIFFDGRHCYSVDNVGQFFLDDLTKRQMASLRDAKDRY